MDDSENMQRTYAASCFMLELDDKKAVGFLRSLEGGGIRTDVLDYRSIVVRSDGGRAGLWRQLAKPKYENIKIQVGMSMADIFYEWLEKFFAGEVVRKDGAILAGDFHYKVRARRTIRGADQRGHDPEARRFRPQRVLHDRDARPDAHPVRERQRKGRHQDGPPARSEAVDSEQLRALDRQVRPGLSPRDAGR
jgi:hypothetical protein